MMNKTTNTVMTEDFKSWQIRNQSKKKYRHHTGRPSTYRRKEFGYLAEVIRLEDEARRADQHRAIVRFSERIERMILSGAKDRETALRWIHEADGSNRDEEYLAYLNGLPYGYFKSTDSVN